MATQLEGVTVADTAREAAAAADVVIVSLADDAAVRAAYRGEDGLVAGLGPGTVVADTSTVAPETIRGLEDDVRAAGAALVDTPVSGSVSSVEGGTILVMAGGEPDAVERARPALESFAHRIILLGPLGSGSTMKLAVNAMVFGLNQTLAEALVLAEKAGVERELAYEVIANSAVAAPFVSYKRAAYEHPESTRRSPSPSTWSPRTSTSPPPSPSASAPPSPSSRPTAASSVTRSTPAWATPTSAPSPYTCGVEPDSPASAEQSVGDGFPDELGDVDDQVGALLVRSIDAAPRPRTRTRRR